MILNISQRFAETEAVVILTMFIQSYKIELKEEPQYMNETFEDRKKRLMYGTAELALTYVFPMCSAASYSHCACTATVQNQCL